MNDLDWVNGDPVELRRAYAAERAELDATAPVDVTVTDEVRAGLSGLHFEPPSPKAEPILYFHGGSWMLGSPDTHRALCAWLALLTSRRVISVSYPLAPEHPWPAQLHAAKATLAAIMNHESQRLFVAGDSAGGAMALWAAQGEVERVAGIAVFYPAYGVTASPSIDAHGPVNPALNTAAIAAMYDRLGCDPTELQNAVPPEGAPTLIIAAKEDPLFDDSLMLATALSAREVTLWEAMGEEHAFLHHGGASETVRAWLSRVGAWMDSQTQV